MRSKLGVVAIMGISVFPLWCGSETIAEDPQEASALTLADVAAGRARIIDLSYSLNPESHFWPGPGYAPFQIETIATLKADGVYSRKISFPEHIGTHLDAPNHFEADEPDVSRIPVEQFFAPGVMIDISLQVEQNPDTTLSVADLENWEKEHGRIPDQAIVLVNTGWGQFWNSKERFQNRDARGQMHFPGYSGEATRWLIEQRKVKGIGIDTMSIDPGISKNFEVHHLINRAQGYGLENVASLDQLPARDFWLMVAPIKVEGGTGGPCRIFAILQ
ncbi:cyclase family protein [Planctomicrobium sp. SH661]|uniref:cyclase family protein n=1 Tax=Planctomicrobium sp. SH661 TaxID=3448124 RepID=UPI003F5BE632